MVPNDRIPRDMEVCIESFRTTHHFDVPHDSNLLTNIESDHSIEDGSNESAGKIWQQSTRKICHHKLHMDVMVKCRCQDVRSSYIPVRSHVLNHLEHRRHLPVFEVVPSTVRSR